MTIAEIAARAGVSKTAVSRYLNNGYVSAEKREAIRHVIEETGYVPSRQAQTLRTGRSRTIGVIVPRIDSEAIGRIVAGISAELERQGYRLLLADTYNRAEKELEYLEVFQNGNVDGILLVATMVTAAHKKVITLGKPPVVVIGQRIEGVSCVYHNDYAAAYTMTKLLAEHGEIGFIGVTLRDKAAGAARQDGYLNAMQEAGNTEANAWIEYSDFSVEGGEAAAKRLLQRAPALKGIFCATDSIAIGAMRSVRSQGKRIPEEIALAGIGHSQLSELITPCLTTVHYYYHTSGEEATRILLQIIEQGIDQKKQLMLGFEVCTRETT